VTVNTIDIMAERRTGPQHVDSVGQIQALVQLCEKLGLPDELAASRRLLDRSEQLGADARSAKADAQKRFQQAYRRLVSGELDAAAFGLELVPLLPWLDGEPDMANMKPNPALAAAVVTNAARERRSSAVQMLAAEAPGIHAKLRSIAEETVVATGEVAPGLPRAAWSAPDPSAVVAREGQAAVLRVLWELSARFDDMHAAARICRDSGGLGAEAMLPTAPEPLGFTVLNYRKALEDMPKFKAVKPPLKLAWMVREGWRPGLWTASDHRQAEQQPEPSLLHRVKGFLIPSPLVSDGKPVQVGP
jgi:hypothetical protein